MRSLVIICEGHTERTFVANTITPHLRDLGVRVLHWNLEGLTDYDDFRYHVTNWKLDGQLSEGWCTTMVDLYALPDGFPGWDDAQSRSWCAPRDKAIFLQDQLRGEVASERFIPYIELHEFEALLFTDIGQLAAEFPGHLSAGGIGRLVDSAKQFATPEDIDEDPQGAPSKRIIAEVWEYEDRKATVGPAIAAAIGLPAIRKACPHFNNWLATLECLGQASPSEAAP